MAEILKRNKALSVSPLKTSQPVGASLAFLGFQKSMPMMHGSQGCTAFGKVFFVRHFREPVPLQTTAMDQVSSIMGADDSVVEGLKTIAEKSKPALIGVVTTGLSETQGTDIRRTVRMFREQYPELSHVKVVPVNTPDFVGCLESGFALAVTAMIEYLVPTAEEAKTQPAMRPRQVTVLVGSTLTPGDLEYLEETIESFGLRPVLIPHLGDSLDGHVSDGYLDYTPLTMGGTAVSEFETLGMSAATLVIGHSLTKAADLLKQKTGVPDYRFDSLMGIEAVDRFLTTLQSISGTPVPAKYERQRAQLQDAMLDTHFMLGQARIAIAGDPDEVYGFSQFLVGMGAEIVTAVVSSHVHTGILEQIPTTSVKVGDLEDLEKSAKEQQAQIVIGNSHAVESAQRLGVPILRAGFPQYDFVGGYQRTWIGYKGSRQTLFDLANLMLSQHANHEIKPYYSRYAQKQEAAYASPTTFADSRLQH
ncbi:nitrogenase molybdenum-iron cofactor biosynthesis protein NifN [Beggiatoa alba B18LD]|uniref:Nitrogenase iron-molybdenum cofactor biosynthesis protein NifN n=1 Tax=Beggiatoa alba B18LD TaxID=395493 RepID=I3CDL0_9GAMM|nr:nitrogenase iron-molybdenum cofactor biosynthesis protein NifN [Beggiatoa alba]EIJ41703.1 nitrogenase molybdenum-iron cofactor biosynthesis protein NifN [Beggiatoa alba B18LD]